MVCEFHTAPKVCRQNAIDEPCSKAPFFSGNHGRSSDFVPFKPEYPEVFSVVLRPSDVDQALRIGQRPVLCSVRGQLVDGKRKGKRLFRADGNVRTGYNNPPVSGPMRLKGFANDVPY